MEGEYPRFKSSYLQEELAEAFPHPCARALVLLGAELCGQALVISGAVRMARLREAQEHPDWKWEGERRRAIRDRVEATRPGPPRRSVVPVTGGLRRNVAEKSGSDLRHGIDGDN